MPVLITHFGADPTGVVDSTAALHAAVAALATIGGGVLEIPPGEYQLSGPLQDTSNSNSQIVLPTVALTDPTITITLKGQLAPPTQFFSDFVLPTTGYVKFKSTLTGKSGTAAIISGPSASTSTGPQNNVVLNLENLIFEVPPDPTITAVNLQYQQAGFVRRVLIHCGSVDLNSLVEPTHNNACGIKMPDYNHTPWSQIDGLTVFGYYFGMRGGELVVGDGLRFWGCSRALAVPFAYHPSLIQSLGVYWCPYGIVAVGGDGDGTARLRVQMLDIEHANGQGAAWQNCVYDIDDSGNKLYGDVRWTSIASAVGNDHTLTVNGASHFASQEIDTQTAGPTAPVFSAAEVGTVSATTVAVTFSKSVKASSYSAGVIVKVDGTPATISSATRQATKSIVHYVLSAAVTTGQTVTWEYAAIDGFITESAGVAMADASAQSVTNNVGGGGGVLVLDNFTDTNATALSAHSIAPTNTPATSWTNDEGTLEIQSNKARPSADTGVRSSSVNAAVADCTITVVVRRGNLGDGGIKFRQQDSANYWIADFLSSTNTFKLYEKNAGTYTERASTAITFTVNTDYTMQVVLSGNSIIATLNGGDTISFTSSSFASQTKHGLWVSLGSDGTDFTWDSFKIES